MCGGGGVAVRLLLLLGGGGVGVVLVDKSREQFKECAANEEGSSVRISAPAEDCFAFSRGKKKKVN